MLDLLDLKTIQYDAEHSTCRKCTGECTHYYGNGCKPNMMGDEK